MRLILATRRRTLLDVEILAFLPAEPQDQDQGPTLRANGGGQHERAQHYGDPATISGFGFRA